MAEAGAGPLYPPYGQCVRPSCPSVHIAKRPALQYHRRRGRGTFMSVRVDKIDWQIIRILEKNGRAPNKEIAEQIGVSEGPVRNRIKKLTDHQFLRIRGLTK